MNLAPLITRLVTLTVLATLAMPAGVIANATTTATASTARVARVVSFSADQASSSVAATSLSPATVVRGTAAQQTTVDRTVAGFVDLDMALPDLEIRFWTDTDRCDGHLGLFRAESGTIEICSELAFVLPHEIGHAWERVTLHDAARQVYMSARGFDVWQSADAHRNDEAIEDVAFVIQLVVLGGGQSGRPDIDEAFELLTQLAMP
jgi:hypothetical protein